jgi:multimeric flavodoxin WrbA
MIEKALLLVGSPKAEQSTSASLGNYITSKLEESGMTSEKLFIHRVVNREEKVKNLLNEIEAVDLIILTFPLYVDSLPAPVIKAMELIKDNRTSLNSKKHQNFIAIANNGFPEASQNDTALKICRNFSKECGFIWKGGIAVGGGGTINGVPLLEKPGMFRNFIRGLDLVAQALKDDKEIPQEAHDFISKKLIPDSIYRFIGNYSWRSQAKRYGVKQKIKQKPY